MTIYYKGLCAAPGLVREPAVRGGVVDYLGLFQFVAKQVCLFW